MLKWKEVFKKIKKKRTSLHTKDGRMRLVAKKCEKKPKIWKVLRSQYGERTKQFVNLPSPAQEDLVNEFLKISSVTVMQDHKEVTKPAKVFLEKNKHLLIGRTKRHRKNHIHRVSN